MHILDVGNLVAAIVAEEDKYVVDVYHILFVGTVFVRLIIVPTLVYGPRAFVGGPRVRGIGNGESEGHTHVVAANSIVVVAIGGASSKHRA